MSIFAKLTLGAAGLTALGIGLAITFVPHGFYTGYGLDIGSDPARLSELRAPGANLAALGAVIFAGALRPALARLSAALATLVFLAFAFGRAVSWPLDGWPGDKIASAFALEILLGGLCLLVWRSLARRPGTQGKKRQLAADIA
ncbi:DUF4345 domain-containing protein [Celeribacter neptunius]|uniref:DUF4345 domain-containing protein n=1 Tax=Celeribacter neptunius TaxID=588602 RepID=A0A1I3JYT6_9RHOB|nr:DUF4345 domain-containing protein [Celeribacter neptunius]SFI65218.1 protein of unknown function [Celeribacter neptunius]